MSPAASGVAVRRWSVVDVLVALLIAGLAASISLAQAALAALAVALVVARARGRGPALTGPLLLPVAAFAAWTVVAALASARPLESLITAKSLLSLGAFYVVLHALPGAAAARRFVAALFWVVSGVALLAIAQVTLCPAEPPAVPLLGAFFRKCARARGFFSIYMTLAGVLMLVLASALPRLARLAAESRLLGPAWLAGAAALGLTYVRGAWVGFAVAALGAVFTVRRRLLAAAALLVLAVALPAALPGVASRLATIGDVRDDTTRERLSMLTAGLHLFREHPLTGVGPGQVKHLYPVVAPPEAMRRTTSHLHNSPLQILVERGVPGLAAWLLIFALFFVRARAVLGRLPAEAEAERALVQGAMLAVAAFLVAGLFEYNFGDTEVLMVAASLMALPFVVERDLAACPATIAAP